MKKIWLFLFVASVIWASDIKGVIESIDDGNKTIKVGGNLIYVLPYTEIEKDSCGSGWDIPQKFADLRVNDTVKIDVFYDNGRIMAKEIDVLCYRAY